MIQPRHNLAGFTVIELVVVIVIIGVLSAYAVPKLFDRTPFAERGYADELATALRYSQKVAVASGCNVTINWDANGYQASLLAGAHPECSDLAITRMDGSPLSGSCPSDVTCPATGSLTFNAEGKSSAAASIAVGPHTITTDNYSGLVVVQ